MLVLTRKQNESIIIDGKIEVTVARIDGKQVRIGITAPRYMSIDRKELTLSHAYNRKQTAQKNIGNKVLCRQA